MNSKTVELTIPIEELDTADLLAPWRWLVSRNFRPIQMSKFGDWILADERGRVFFLDLVEGSLKKIADSIAEYKRIKDLPENHSRWFLDGFVFRCDAEALMLNLGECYGWKVHPKIGGRFEFENIQVFFLRVYQSIMGQLAEQFRNLKPGEPISPLKFESN